MKVINMDDHRPPGSPSSTAKVINETIDQNKKDAIHEIDTWIWILSYTISRLVHAQGDIVTTVDTIDQIFSQYADPSVYEGLYKSPPDVDQ